MGFFPYFTPLYPWAVDEMQRREDNLVSTTFKNPWITLISPALVVKGVESDFTEPDEKLRANKIKELIQNPESRKCYKGCIISNNINNLELSYAPNETIVGIDFEGNYIKVDGEQGRKVSTPVINSVDVDTDGANNTLKTAKVNITCFTLKQLEMFEMFFMKPGMNVLVEWGDNSLLTYNQFQLKGSNAPYNPVTNNNITNKSNRNINEKKYSRPEEAMVLNQKENNGANKYDLFCENFSKYFRSDTSALVDYLERLQRSKGTYDLVAGKVLDYSFSVNDDGTYSANIEISQGNQMTMFLPKNATKPSNTASEKTQGVELSSFDQIKTQMISDFDLDKDAFEKMLKREHPEGGSNQKWMDDWFNFIKINKEQKDTVASSKAYISLRFILQILANYAIKEVPDSTTKQKTLVDDFFMLKLPIWKVDGQEKTIIPCNSNALIFSSNEDIIFPLSEPPGFQAPTYITGSDGKTQMKNEFEENEIKLVAGSDKDSKIGSYDFHVSANSLEHLINDTGSDTKLQKITINKDNGERLGNALNIFLSYDKVVSAWRRAYTRKDFLESVLEMCNNNSYGLFRLVYGNMGENGAPTKGPTIIDVKFTGFEGLDPKKDEITYRFKPTTLKSIVKQFTFNFEMSNLVAGRTIFNSNKFLEEAIKEKKKAGEEVIVEKLDLPASAYKSVDNSTFGNADGWYSINKVELSVMQKKFSDAKDVEKAGGKTGTQSEKDQNQNTEATKEVQNLNEVIKNKSTYFITDANKNSDLKILVFRDTPLIQQSITNSKQKARAPVVSPIEVSLTIDGFSGFSCGQYFNIDGIPEIYNKIGVFQITNTKHNITKDGWTTTIEAMHRVVNKK